jgi:PRTRC genetic system protein C
MPVTVTALEREFVFDGHPLPDPNPNMSVEQVRETYIPTHPEITTAAVTGPEAIDGKLRYTFSRAIRPQGITCHGEIRKGASFARFNESQSRRNPQTHKC